MTPTETTTILRQYREWLCDTPKSVRPRTRQINEAIDAAVEMIDRLEAAEKERDNLRAKVEQLTEAEAVMRRNAFEYQAEAERLRAKIEHMEQQEPVAWARKLAMGLPSFGCVTDLKYRPSNMPESAYMPLYALPGAQPAPSVPEDVMPNAEITGG